MREELAADCVFVARLGDEVVGCVRGNLTEDGAAAIGKLCVHPRLQGHGIGARLLRAAESALAEERGAKKFRLFTGHRSEGNLRLYRRVGYETVGTSQGADGVPMIVLEKQAGSTRPPRSARAAIRRRRSGSAAASTGPTAAAGPG